MSSFATIVYRFFNFEIEKSDNMDLTILHTGIKNFIDRNVSLC